MIFVVALFVLSLDQFTKFLVTKNLSYNESFPVIKDIFHFTLVFNKGAAFGILKNQTPLFIFTSLFAIILIFFNLKNVGHKKIYSVSLILILAGAVGNLIDRLFFGYVIDFLDFRVWPVFNVADSAITVGAALLGYCMLSEEVHSLKQGAKK